MTHAAPESTTQTPLAAHAHAVRGGRAPVASRHSRRVSGLLAAVLTAFAAPVTGQRAERYHPFQQGVEYRIEAGLDAASHVLEGRARLRYTNNADVALDRLYFHQYLNAFRPNSAWARGDLEVGNRTFQELGPEGHGFERVTSFTVDGRAVEPVYPGSPDSTVFYVRLPEPLEPGASLEATIDWTARLSTAPRRQGREGRHYNWAHWYPRIAFFGADGWEYRAHVRAGEFNGSFAGYDITLELPADLVVAATGVPVYGDPGWEAAMVSGSEPPLYRREFYGGRPARDLGLLEADPRPDRKRIRWRAEDVHHFAWSASPDYRYLGGRWRDRPIHLVWGAANERWDPEATLARQREALDWLVELFGEYPWPQLTISDRVEDGGATEYPMYYMTDAGGAVVHETMHMMAHGILANNEWASGWLDEGMARFLSAWLRVEEGADPEEVWGRTRDVIAAMDRAGRSEPVGLPGAEFSSYRMYSLMTYTKGSLVLRMLRDMIGEDVFRRGLREYYRRYRFHNVTPADFRSVMEQVSDRDLEWFFHQWLDTTRWLDYRVAGARVSGGPGGYTVTVEIARDGEAWMPVVVRVGDVAETVDSRDPRFTVTLHPTTRPGAVILDPAGSLMDADRRNNRRSLP